MTEPNPRIRRVVVVGLMAVGKSTVGHALARHLGWRFDDSDDAIEAETGLTVREIRDLRGEAAMSEAESRHLLDALAAPPDVVVAAAAGIVDDRRCIDALHGPGILVVWLRGSPKLLAERFRDQPHRPWYGNDPATFLARQAAERSPRYASLDPLVIDIDGRSKDQVVAATIAAVDARLDG
jgi:shikimate kinase